MKSRRAFSGLASPGFYYFIGLVFTLILAACGSDNDHSLAKALEKIRTQQKVPAVAGAIVANGGLSEAAVAGVRKSDDSTRVTVDDQFHLGSNTKAMTAYLAAMFVDAGQLSFETKILSVFPEMVTSADPGYQDVTVAHLLAHRAGLNDDELIAAYGDDLPDTLALPDQRAWVVEKVLSTPPSNVGNYAYSNLGYILAGAILERRSGNSWEDLIQTRLFEPLGMDSAGFGPPGTPGALDQPWGHQLEGTQIIPSQIDNPKIYGPAGRVHCSIGDWAKFIQEFMNCLRGETALVSAANCEKIATPWPGGDYGFGWQVVSTNGVTVLLHDGSNDYFYSLAVVNPAINTAILAATNIGGDRGALAVNAVIQELAGRVDQD